MKRVQTLRKRLAEERIDALLVTDAIDRRYITGFTGTAGFALISGNAAHLITDFRYMTQAKAQAPHFELIQHGDSVWQTIADACADLGIDTLAFDEQHLTVAEHRALAEHAKNVTLLPSSGVVATLRQVKDDDELDILSKAAKIADQAFSHILTFIKSGLTEREVALELEMTMRRLGAASSSFETIVASGFRSALPHGVASDKRIEEGDLVTLDFGAVYKGYCSDLTRTVMIGEPNKKQREIYDIVLTAQKRVIEGLKPGMTGRDADAIARDYISERGYGDYFGHGTGHGLGLDVHESPRLSRTSETELKPGMVVTVEPGIYLPQFGGVRIEDDVVITEEGCRRLTHSSKELMML